MVRFHKLLGGVIAAIGLSGCSLLTALPTPTTTDRRLASFPTTDLPLQQAVTIGWDAHQIPFIEAQTDSDAAFALGMVQAHLRLGQITLAKHLTQGRVSELAGPITIDFDRAIRTVGLGRAAPAIYQALPPDTKQWLDQFVAGLNTYQNRMDEHPHA
ncbi:MAG: penicillin acylase family protein [Pseudomonadota bacterium]